MATLDNISTGMVRAPIASAPELPFHLLIDESLRVVRTRTHGFWTMDEAEDYLAALQELIEASRRRFGRVRVLADRRGNPIQAEPVAHRLGQANARLFAGGDRLAVVVDSSLAKRQMRRHFVHDGSQAFLSLTAAELWLTAWS